VSRSPGAITPRLTVVGIGAGISAGLLGLGGGIVLVPGLVWATGMSRHRATATSLLAIIPIAIVAAITYAVAPGGSFDAPASGFLVAGSLAGSLIGVRINARLSERGLRIVWALVVGVLGARLAIPFGFHGGSTTLAITVGGAAILVVLGLVAGILSGMLGVGGGGVIVPVMVLALGTTQALSQGVSLTSIIPTALVGTAAYHRRGMLEVRPGVVAGLIGAVAAIPASLLAIALPSAVLRTTFGVVMLLISVRVLRTQLRASQQRAT
jgi:uncharacterized membrane protein YfcA